MTMPSKTSRPTATPTAALRRRVVRFRRDEEGGFIIFTLYLFIMMLMIGGLAVDFMRYEITRSRLQNTLDRAILAAADLDQTLPPEDVVQNYFDINGMTQFLNTPTIVTGGINYRTVNANASATIPMMFANMIGIETMDTMTVATATESVEDIEITLVLDISTSMASNNKLEEMKAAAKDFIRIIYAQNETEDISISIVPYSTQVNVGYDIMRDMTVDWQHDESFCVDFTSSDYTVPWIRPSRQAVQTAHFDPWYTWGPTVTETERNHVCRYGTSSEIMMLNNVQSELMAHIDGLVAGGNTSIDIGVKWGVALLHDEFRPVVDAAIARDEVPEAFSGRPYSNTSGQSIKIMVVMTDGENTDEFRLNGSMRTGYSDARLDPRTGLFYIRGSEYGDRDRDGIRDEGWYVPHLYPNGNFWRSNGDGVDRNPNYAYLHGEDDDHTRTYTGIDGNGTWSNQVSAMSARTFNYSSDIDIDASDYRPSGSNTISNQTVRLKYDELYDRVSLRYHAYHHMYAQRWWASDYYAHVNDIMWSVGGTTKNSQMHNICNAAKTYGVTIYTIGFEVKDPSAIVMEDCASSPSHFFRVAGDEIGDAFRSIARQVNELRLIQ